MWEEEKGRQIRDGMFEGFYQTSKAAKTANSSVEHIDEQKVIRLLYQRWQRRDLFALYSVNQSAPL
jgi:hypothetical protein